MAVEFWDFGALSHFTAGMKHNDLTALAAEFQIPRQELLTSWIKSIHIVRNTCAHHSRLWNRPLPVYPKRPKLGEHPLLDHLANATVSQTRLYAVAAAIQFLMKVMHPGSEWGERLKAHVATFPLGPNLSFGQGAGFPPNWRNLSLWN